MVPRRVSPPTALTATPTDQISGCVSVHELSIIAEPTPIMLRTRQVWGMPGRQRRGDRNLLHLRLCCSYSPRIRITNPWDPKLGDYCFCLFLSRSLDRMHRGCSLPTCPASPCCYMSGSLQQSLIHSPSGSQDASVESSASRFARGGCPSRCFLQTPPRPGDQPAH